MKLLAALVLLSFTSTIASAACPNKHEILDNSSFQSIDGINGCMMTLTPRDSTAMTYRSFLIQQSGMFMVFNSLGNGPEDTSAGAREYFFFPRTQEMSYSYDSNAKTLSVVGPSGKVFVFNTVKTILVSISNTEFNTDHEINASNNGGIEITKNDSWYLDAGFKIGQSPTQNPTRKITFKDTVGGSCQVKNSDVFKYDADQDAFFRYTDVQFPKFLAKKCPKLKL